MDQAKFKEHVFSSVRKHYDRARGAFIPHVIVLSCIDLKGRKYDEPGVSVMLLDPELFGMPGGADTAREFAKGKAKELGALSVAFVATGSSLTMDGKDRRPVLIVTYQDKEMPYEVWAAHVEVGEDGIYKELEKFQRITLEQYIHGDELLPKADRREIN